MKRIPGPWWVVALLALGAAAGLFAALYWTSPANGVRWSFTQIHTSLVRGNRAAAEALVADGVLEDGRPLPRRLFLDTYTPDQPARIQAQPCPAVPDHWTVRMRDKAYCFLREGRAWKLHALGPVPCACRSSTGCAHDPQRQ